MEIFYSDTIENGICRLGEEESAHCVRVLRHREGDRIDVIDGEGALYECRIVKASPKGTEASVEAVKEGWGSHPYRLTLAVCPTKNIDRYEWMAEKATELGLDELVPVIGERSERKVVKDERLRRILLSATKQSLKAKIPALHEPLSVKEFINEADSSSLKMIAYCLDGQNRRISIGQALADFSFSAPPRISVLIGPEGDFSPAEVELALEKGFIPVHFGPSRLRTETAGLLAAQAVYSRFCL